MVQNYEEEETKEIIHAPISPRRQVCSYLLMKQCLISHNFIYDFLYFTFSSLN